MSSNEITPKPANAGRKKLASIPAPVQSQERRDYMDALGVPNLAPHNPGNFQDLVTLARTFTADAFMEIMSIMRNPMTPAADRLRAANMILERGWGKTPQEIFVNDDEEKKPVALKDSDVIDKLTRIVGKIAAAEAKSAEAES